MSATNNDPNVTSEIARLKVQCKKQTARALWLFCAVFIASVAVGVWIWFYIPAARDGVQGPVYAVLGMLAFFAVLFVVCIIDNAISPSVTPKCPKCGYLWERDQPESGDGHDWHTWKCCPGCGLKMMD